MFGKYDEYQANIEQSRLLGAYFRCALNSVNELGLCYNDSGNLKCLYLIGVCNCAKIETSLSKEIVIMGISCLKVSL